MNLTDLLAELDANRIRIEVVDGRMRVDAPVGALSARLRAALLQHRSELLALLEGKAAAPGRLPGPHGAAEAGKQAEGMGERTAGAGERRPARPASGRDPLLLSALDAGATVRIPLEELAYGDFLERNRLRIVDGAAYPDGRTFRPTIYLAEVDGETGERGDTGTREHSRRGSSPA
jgi:hypothetical protein